MSYPFKIVQRINAINITIFGKSIRSSWSNLVTTSRLIKPFTNSRTRVKSAVSWFENALCEMIHQGHLRLRLIFECFLSAYPSFFPSWWVVGCGCHPGSLQGTVSERSVAHVRLVESSEAQTGYLKPPGKERKNTLLYSGLFLIFQLLLF